VAHYLTFPRVSRQRKAVRAFADWIVSELALDEHPAKIP
jgi:hypothetical protein